VHSAFSRLAWFSDVSFNSNVSVGVKALLTFEAREKANVLEHCFGFSLT